jgi:hypothetical protein
LIIRRAIKKAHNNAVLEHTGQLSLLRGGSRIDTAISAIRDRFGNKGLQLIIFARSKI